MAPTTPSLRRAYPVSRQHVTHDRVPMDLNGVVEKLPVAGDEFLRKRIALIATVGVRRRPERPMLPAPLALPDVSDDRGAGKVLNLKSLVSGLEHCGVSVN